MKLIFDMLGQNLATLSTIINIPIYALVLLAIVPSIATLVSIGRHVIGSNSFNTYVPIVTSLVFLELGFLPGIIISSIVFLTTLFTRRVLLRYRMHYFVRISFIYTVVCFVLFIFLVLFYSLYAKFDLSGNSILSFEPIFPIILLVTLVEEYFNTVVKEGENKVFIMFLETLAISIIAFVIVSSAFFIQVLVDNIWILLLLFPINVVLARWEGLRFVEIFRFKSVISSEMRRIEETETESKKKSKKSKNNSDKDTSSGKKNASFLW